MLSMRQQLYKRNRLSGMNQINAARAAGYSETMARCKAYRIERSVKVGMADAFERAGLTDKKIVTHCLQGLEAEKIQAVGFKSVVVPDWKVRHSYLHTICELTEKISDKPLIDQSTHEHFTVVLKHPEPKQNGNQGSPESLRADGEASVGPRHIALA